MECVAKNGRGISFEIWEAACIAKQVNRVDKYNIACRWQRVEERRMFSRNMAWKMKRALTGLLAAGLVLTSVPTPAVWAANEVLEEEHLQ